MSEAHVVQSDDDRRPIGKVIGIDHEVWAGFVVTFNFALLVMAALSFTSGGVFMKHSEGLRRFTPSLLTGILFLAGAACQALAMRREEMSVAYIVVLGFASVLAFVFE